MSDILTFYMFVDGLAHLEKMQLVSQLSKMFFEPILLLRQY